MTPIESVQQPSSALVAENSTSSVSPPVKTNKARLKQRLRLTNASLYFALVMVFVLLGAVNYQSNAAYLVFAVVVSTAVMSVLHAWQNVRGITITPGRTFAVFAGESLRAQVTLIGSGRDSWALVIDAPDVAEDDGVPLEHLPAGAAVSMELVLPGRRRGVHTLDRVRLASVYPMGLMTAILEVPAAWTWVVYPSPLAGGGGGEPQGDEHLIGIRSGATGDFHGHRAYQPGEPQRRIDWRAVARGRPLLVKDYAVNGVSDGWIDWNDDPISDVERHLSLLAGRVVAADRIGQRYGLRLPERTIGLNSGVEHYHTCLNALALYQVKA